MATYLLPSDSSIADGSPVTQQLIQSLADNPTAIAQGAAGAPRFKEESAIDSGILAGDYGVFEIDTGLAGRNDLDSLDVKVIAGGVFNYEVNVRKYHSSGEARGQIYLNDSLVASTPTETGTGTESVTGSLSVSAGDIVHIRLDITSLMNFNEVAQVNGLFSIHLDTMPSSRYFFGKKQANFGI